MRVPGFSGPALTPELLFHNLATDSFLISEQSLRANHPQSNLKIAIIEGVISPRDLLAYGLAGYSGVGLPVKSEVADFQVMEPMGFMGHDFFHTGSRFALKKSLRQACYEFVALLDCVKDWIDDEVLTSKIDNFFNRVNDAALLSRKDFASLYPKVLAHLKRKDQMKAAFFEIVYKGQVLPLVMQIPFDLNLPDLSELSLKPDKYNTLDNPFEKIIVSNNFKFHS